MITATSQRKRRRVPSEKKQLEKLARRQKAMFEKPLLGYLFSPKEFQGFTGGNYLKDIFKAIPEKKILKGLPPSRRAQTRKGRKPFPRRAMLRAQMARIALQIPSYAALAVRLRQDLFLKYECGFELGHGTPGEDCLEDFAQLLGKHTEVLQEAHATIVDELALELPGFGESTSWDSAHLPILKPSEKEASTEESEKQQAPSSNSQLNHSKEESPSESSETNKGKKKKNRKENSRSMKGAASRKKETTKPLPLQADWGIKTYDTIQEKKVKLSDDTTVDGIEVKKERTKLFGGKMHVIIDNRYRLPLRVEVTSQSQADCPMILPMYRKLYERHGFIDFRFAMVDKAGDSKEVHRGLIDEMGITPFIPLREISNRETLADPTYEFPKTVYDRDRLTHCLDPRTGKYEECEPWGYDRTRQALKYRCACQPMRKQGTIKSKALCPFLGAGCGASRDESPYTFWIPLKENWRYYGPVPRESKRWKKAYKQRTTIERVNSLAKGPLQLGEKRTRTLTTSGCEAHLVCLFLCARAKVAIQWGSPEKIGTAVSHIPYRRARLVI